MAIGGYTSVLLVTKAGLSFWFGLPSGMVIAGIVAYLLARLALRVKGIFFGVLSIAFAEMIVLLLASYRSVTGGWTGIRTVPRPDSIVIAGRTIVEFSSNTSIYYLGLVLTVICLVVMYRLEKSRIGRTLKNIAANEELSKSIGVNTVEYQALAFFIGCAFAGMAGSFEAHYGGYITSANFDVWRSIIIFIYVAVGGPSIAGAALGAITLIALTEFLSPLAEFQHMTYAVILILIVLLLKGGLISITELIPRWVRGVFQRN
jgi:branched-chain amino acid transport system permease protein